MNAERLLTQYERIADTPDAIARLRRFILDLAIRGKLVPQNSGDEPASELLKRIANEKMRLVKSEEIRVPKAILAIDAAPFEIPTNWRWSQLAEIGILSPRNDAPNKLKASFVPMPLISAEYGEANKHEVRPWGEIKKGYTHFSEGDVGLAKITPCFENGKSTVFCGLTGGFGSGTTELHIVRPLFVNQYYILLFLKSPHFIETGIPKMTGTAGQKRVPMEYFANSPFPLPPLPEQNRIVAKVDELMALCDRLEAARTEREAARDRLVAASLARLNTSDPETFQSDARFALNTLHTLTTRPDQIKELRQTILNLAVRGKLVPQDPADESASHLLELVADIKRNLLRSKKLKNNTPITHSISNRENLEVPRSWRWASCDELFFVTKLAGFEYTKYFDLKDEGEVPVLRAQNVRPWVIEERNLKYLTLKTSLILERSAVTKPSILITFIGAGIGDVALIDPVKRWHLAPNVAKAELFEGCERLLNLQYIVLFFNSPIGRAEIFKHVKTTAQPSLSMATIRDVDVIVPPLAEQHRIVAKVGELMSLCDRLAKSLTATATTRRRLLDALLAEALAPAEDRDLEAAE